MRRVEASIYLFGVVVGLVGTAGLVTSYLEAHPGPLRVALVVATMVWSLAWVVLVLRDRRGRRLLEAYDASQQVLSSLAEARRAVLRNDDPRSALVSGVRDVTRAALVTLSEIHDQVLQVSTSAGARLEGFRLSLDEPSVARSVIASGEPRQIADIHAESGTSVALRQLELTIGHELHSVAYVPISIGTEVVGLLTAAFRSDDIGLADQAVPILTTLGEEAALAIERERMLRDLNRLSLEDPLTGLANRRGWDGACHGLGRDGGIVMLDLDHFKRLNDTSGHAAGDRVLKQFAAIATMVCRSSDVLARIGGEEFAILSSDGLDLWSVTDRLRSVWLSTNPPVTFSAGIAHRRQGEAVHDLQARADEALYAAKSTGRDRIVVDDVLTPDNARVT